MGMIFARVALVALAFSLAPALAQDASEPTPPEPDGYWTGPMQGPTPATIAGGAVVTTEGVADLIVKGDVALIDVLAAQRRPPNPDEPWLPGPHPSLPGAAWIPGAGAGVITDAMSAYLRDRLEALTSGDRNRLVVFFCRPRCWASWNAAKRAIAEGYRRVLWYRDGVEGWRESGRAVQTAQAEGPDAP